MPEFADIAPPPRQPDETQVLFRQELDQLAARHCAALRYLPGPADRPKDHLSAASLHRLVSSRRVSFRTWPSETCASAARRGRHAQAVPVCARRACQCRQVREERFTL